MQGAFVARPGDHAAARAIFPKAYADRDNLRRYTGRTSKLENVASMIHPLAAAAAEPLLTSIDSLRFSRLIPRFRRRSAADQGISTILPLSPPCSEIRWAS
jgi:hypothetical protein